MTNARRLRGGPLGTANGRGYTRSIFLVQSKLQHGIGTYIQGLYHHKGGQNRKFGGGGGGGELCGGPLGTEEGKVYILAVNTGGYHA